MTDKLTKIFFDTFGIEPREQEVFVLKRMIVREYPQISDRILLELICIYSRIRNLAICVNEVEELKEDILEQFIENSEDFKHQVRKLFEEV